jgi:hypothetical protein
MRGLKHFPVGAALTVMGLLCSCARIPELTEGDLNAAEQRWAQVAPARYRAVIEMTGERVEAGTFQVEISGGRVVRLSRNGLAVEPERMEDYSIDGLFDILRRELELALTPRLIGAPEGYQAYLFAEFDEETGRLERYRRTVGGASNAVEIEIIAFEVF